MLFNAKIFAPFRGLAYHSSRRCLGGRRPETTMYGFDVVVRIFARQGSSSWGWHPRLICSIPETVLTIVIDDGNRAPTRSRRRVPRSRPRWCNQSSSALHFQMTTTDWLHSLDLIRTVVRSTSKKAGPLELPRNFQTLLEFWPLENFDHRQKHRAVAAEVITRLRPGLHAKIENGIDLFARVYVAVIYVK